MIYVLLFFNRLTHFRMADLGNAYKLQTALNAGFLGGGLLCYFKGRLNFISTCCISKRENCSMIYCLSFH